MKINEIVSFDGFFLTVMKENKKVKYGASNLRKPAIKLGGSSSSYVDGMIFAAMAGRMGLI